MYDTKKLQEAAKLLTSAAKRGEDEMGRRIIYAMHDMDDRLDIDLRKTYRTFGIRSKHQEGLMLPPTKYTQASEKWKAFIRSGK